MGWCWSTFSDVGPTSNHHWINVWCLCWDRTFGFWGAPLIILTHKALNYFLYKPWKLKGFFPFEVATNVLFRSLRFIWIPMLWVYDCYKLFYTSIAEFNFRRQILTSKVDPRAVRVNINILTSSHFQKKSSDAVQKIVFTIIALSQAPSQMDA